MNYGDCEGSNPFINPFEFWKKIYFTTEDILSATAREAIGTQSYTRLVNAILDSYLTMFKGYRESFDRSMSQAPIPTKKDVARVAELVISLEDKVDQLDNNLLTQLARLVQTMNYMVDHMPGQAEVKKLSIQLEQAQAGYSALHVANELLLRRIQELEAKLPLGAQGGQPNEL